MSMSIDAKGSLNVPNVISLNSKVTKTHLTKKWALAQQLLNNSKMPEEIFDKIIKPALDNTICDFEKKRGSPFEKKTKVYVTKRISRITLKVITNLCTYQIFNIILADVNESQASAMLGDRIGKIGDMIGRSSIYRYFALAMGSIRIAVEQMICPMENELEQRINLALKRLALKKLALKKGNNFKALKQSNHVLAEQNNRLERQITTSQLIFVTPIDPYLLSEESGVDDKPS